MRPLEFDTGRATIDLGDGRTLSIINSDRNDYIREQRQWSPSYILHGWEVTDVQADEGNYEVALIDTEHGFRLDDPIPGWSQYARIIDDETIYCNVPPSAVEALCDSWQVHQ